VSQVSVDTQIPTFVVIKSDDGRTVSTKPADDLAATMLIKAYVPEYFDGLVTFQEAYDLALRRDEEAAHALEMSAAALFDNADDPADDAAAVEVVNMLLETAALEDAAEMQVVVGL